MTMSEAANLPDARRAAFRSNAMLLGAVLALIWLAGQSAAYLVSGVYLDHIEGNVAISGWQYLHGVPLYDLLDGLPRQASYYGPWAYLTPAAGLLLFGGSVGASKALAFVCLPLAIVIMAWHLRLTSSGADRMRGLLILAAGLLFFSRETIWMRPDPFEMLFMSIAVASAGGRRGPLAVGVCAGLIVNFKVHAFLYLLPVVVDVLSRRGWSALLTMGVASFLVFLLPFLLPGISLTAYLEPLLHQLGHRAHSWDGFRDGAILVAAPGIFILLALGKSAWRAQTHDRVYALSVLATIILLLYPSTFPGAGPYHYLPFVPVLAEAFARLRSRDLFAEIAPFVLLFAAISEAAINVERLRYSAPFAAMADEALLLARAADGNTIQVGYGDSHQSYQASQLERTVMTLHGYPSPIDAQLLMELDFIGVDGVTRWLPDLERCRAERWLLPKGERPFAIDGYYNNRPLFTDEFRRVFADRYRLISSSAHFDVWACAGR
jgi:hypothetical protein